LNEKELEDRIWNNTQTWINFTKLHAKVHGDKQTCFRKTNSMIETSQLISKEEGNEKLVKRTNFDNTTEFEFVVEFQENMLKECRLALTTVKKPLFLFDYTVIHTEPPLIVGRPLDNQADKKESKKRIKDYNKNSKKYKIVEEIKIWKIRHWTIKSHLERMLFYTNALLLFISRANMHRTLGIITKSESKRRIEKVEKVLDNHFKKLEIETLDDYAGIRQWFYFHIYSIENFKI